MRPLKAACPIGINPPDHALYMSQYYVPHYVYFVITGQSAVFLNLRTDQYTMLLGVKAAAFRSMLSGAGDSPQELSLASALVPPEQRELRRNLVQELLDNELLTLRVRDAAPARPIIPPPEDKLIMQNDDYRAPPRAGDIWRFVVSCTIAACRLKLQPIERIIRTLERRKLVNRISACRPTRDIRSLISLFNRLRPSYPRDFLCLFDSLSLVEFLARYHHFPNLIFAVRLAPWTAHCWVQQGTLAINQDVDEVSDYWPIMSI